MGKISRKRIVCYLLAFFIPVFMMLVLSMIYGFYPFGKTSVLVADMRYQFVDYYGYLKSIFFGNNDFAYTFSKTFGGDMLGFSSYYLNSLPNLLLLLFPNEYLPAGILLMATLLIGLCGLTFNILLDHLYTTRWASLIFSTAYAFMGFTMAYFNCVHYFFNIALLPLVILGLCNMIENGKISILYIVSLFLSIFSNYYIGYMTCLFTVIFFLYYVFVRTETLKKIKDYRNAFFNYVIASCVAASLSAFTLIPVLFSLSGQKSGVNEANLSFARTFHMIDVFSGLYTTAFHGNISDGLPIIYCGVSTVVFAILFLVNKKVSKRERIVSTLALASVLICFYIHALNLIWHGFNEPIGFPFRDSFFFSFLLLFIAYRGFLNTAGGVQLYQGVICILAYLGYSVYMLFSRNEYVGRDQVVLTGVIILIVLFFIYGFRNKKEYVIPLIVGLFLLQGMDLMYNGYVSLGGYFPDLKENPQDYSFEEYYSFVDQNERILKELEKETPGFYRIEKLYRRSHNDAMMFGYNGLTHFSSCETDQAKNFMGSLGFRNNKNWAFYGQGSTSFADVFMGIKYLLSQYDETPRPYEKRAFEDKYIYKSPYALPIAFCMKNSVRNLAPERYNVFSYQNAIAGAFTDQKYQIYRPVYLASTDLVNVEEDGTHYRKIDPSQEAYLAYHLIANNSDFIYMYFYAPDLQDTTIVIDGLEKDGYFTKYGWSVREVGYFSRGQEIEVRMYLDQDEIQVNKALFYYENLNELARWYEDSKDLGAKLDKVTSSHLVGEVDCKEDEMLVMTIPYESAWKIRIDGKETKPERVLKGIIAVPVQAGKHRIEMRYMPRGLEGGLFLSGAALLFLILLIIYRKKHLQKTTR